MRSGQYALLAAAAEAMYSQNSLTPTLPTGIAAEWTILGYINGLDAVFNMGGGSSYGDRVFYGFLAQNIAAPPRYVVVIRGTENAVEWLIDGNAQPIVPHDCGGMVHAGMWNLYKTLAYTPIGSYVGAILPVLAGDAIASVVPKGAPVVFVGHSLGAVLATYLMTDAARGVFANVWGQIFASPKPGDKAFAAYVDKALPARYTVYNYSRDLVPHAPLTLPFFDYHQLTNVVRITPADGAAAIKTDPGCCHSALSYAALLGEPVLSTCVIGSSP